MPEISTWRLIETPPASGAWNMALDEALIQSVGNREQPPTLRLYAWQPICLSIGYAQSYRNIDPGLLQSVGWDLVRRPSGGRAVLHTDELSYSAVGPIDDPHFKNGILESYRLISTALIEALRLLGVEVQAASQYPMPVEIDKKDPICFFLSSNYEITYQGRKLVGSAQIRRKNAILQHGTMLLSKDFSQITDVLAFTNANNRKAAKDRLEKSAVSLEEILQRHISWNEAAQAFSAAFMKVLSISLVLQEPDNSELVITEQLMQAKYLSDAWTQRV